jgi:hypothetical protein
MHVTFFFGGVHASQIVWKSSQLMVAVSARPEEGANPIADFAFSGCAFHPS